MDAVRLPGNQSIGVALDVERFRDCAHLVFDCDGVILNSNAIKTDAFHAVALPFGESHADDLVAYHKRHGGISRFEKFKYLAERLGVAESDPHFVNQRCEEFAHFVHESLLACEIASGLNELRNAFPDQRWFVVSGGKETELVDVFRQRGIDDLFDGGIHGSPRSKDTILATLRETSGLTTGVFLGDSQYDHEAAVRGGLDFVFVHGWTEVADWPSFCESRRIATVASLQALASQLVELG